MFIHVICSMYIDLHKHSFDQAHIMGNAIQVAPVVTHHVHSVDKFLLC